MKISFLVKIHFYVNHVTIYIELQFLSSSG